MRPELRHGVAPWLVPLVPAVVWVIHGLEVSYPVVYWPVEVSAIAYAMLPLSAVATALGMWEAGRDGRTGTQGLIRTMPRGASSILGRRLALAWLLLAVPFAITAAVILLLRGLSASYGSPNLWPLVDAVAGLAALVALGGLLGWWTKGRRWPIPAVVVAIYFAVGYLGLSSGAFGQLSPAPMGNSPALFFRLRSEVSVARAAVFAGVALLVWTVARVTHRPTSRRTWAAALTAGAMTVGASTWLTAQPPGHAIVRAAGASRACAQGNIEVCVHPAYASVLPEFTQEVTRYLAPVAGESSTVRRVVHVPDTFGLQPDGTLRIPSSTINEQLSANSSGQGLLLTLLEPCVRVGRDVPSAQVTQFVVIDWLLSRVGGDGPRVSPEQETFEQDFAALSSARRHAWLDDNFADVLACRVPTDELP